MGVYKCREMVVCVYVRCVGVYFMHAAMIISFGEAKS